MSGHYPMFTGLLIAIPLSGRPIVPQWAFAFSALHPPMCYNVQIAHTWKAPIAEARNYFAEQAIAHGARYLFFLDEDVTPPGNTLRQLIYQAETHPEGMIFGGIYCHKSPPAMPMIFRGMGAGPYLDWKAGEFFEVDGIAMGCTLIKTEVFQHLPKPWFKTVDDLSPYWDGVAKAEVWTEDLYLSDLVKKAGFKIYADSSILCGHWDYNTMTETLLPKDSPPMRRATTALKGQKKILDLGCGESKYETDEGDVLTVDIRDDVKPDYRADLGSLPFATNEFDICYSSHVLEHFPRSRVATVLDEWIRVLKPEGELRLIVPNLEWAADQIKLGVVNDDVLNVLYGAQSYSQNFHQMGFTPAVLTSMLKERGFKRIDVELVGYNLCTRAWREPPPDMPSLGEPPVEVAKTNGHKKVKAKPAKKRR
jgi:predicted SAM-dependent methyltransferase